MLQFLLFFLLPIAIFWYLGFRRVTAFLLGTLFVVVVLLVGSATGFLFEMLFYPSNVSSYVTPTLFTNNYANNIDNLGQALAIPYIFVFDLFWLIIHYTFTHAKWLMHAFQVASLMIIFKFAEKL